MALLVFAYAELFLHPIVFVNIQSYVRSVFYLWVAKIMYTIYDLFYFSWFMIYSKLVFFANVTNSIKDLFNLLSNFVRSR